MKRYIAAKRRIVTVRGTARRLLRDLYRNQAAAKGCPISQYIREEVRK